MKSLILSAALLSFSVSAIDCDTVSEIAFHTAIAQQSGVTVSELTNRVTGSDLDSKIKRSVIEVAHKKAQTTRPADVAVYMYKQCCIDKAERC